MSVTKPSLFREQALDHYMRSRNREVLPRLISPPVFWCLWLVLCLFLILGWIFWNIRVPGYISGLGTLAVTNQGGAQAVLFVPADQSRNLHVGEPVQLHIGSTGPALLRRVTAVAPTPLAPTQARQRYKLDGTLALLVTQPSVLLLVALDASFPASSYAGSIVHAQIQTGEHSILSFFPGAGEQ